MENGRERVDDDAAARPSSTAPRVVALTIDEDGMAKTAERKLEVARAIHDIAARGVRPGARGSDLRRAHLHARDRRRGVRRQGGRDARGHPPDQARAARRADVARRLERLVRAGAALTAGAELGVPAPLRRRPASTWRSSIPSTRRRTPRSRTSSGSWPRT